MFRDIGSKARGTVIALALFGVTMLVVSTGVIAGPGDDDAVGPSSPSGADFTPIVADSLATATPAGTLVPGILTPNATPRPQATPAAAATPSGSRFNDDGPLHDLNDDNDRNRGHDDDDDDRNEDRSGPNRGGDDDDDNSGSGGGDDNSGRRGGDDDDD